MKTVVLLSSEHSTSKVPARFAQAFAADRSVLDTHRGSDLGVRHLEKAFARQFSIPVICGAVSRLLIELNRSPHHPRLYSEYAKQLPEYLRQELFERYYLPYRNQIADQIQNVLNAGDQCVHLSLHTFTPEFQQEVRNADIGLLYDPRRSAEKHLAALWQTELNSDMPQVAVRRNYPYRGAADGLTTWLRKHFPNRYLGLELEWNQKASTDAKQASRNAAGIAQTAHAAIRHWASTTR